MTEEERMEFEKLKKENEELKQKTNRGLYMKVSEKGAVSLYGLGKFPVTLYREQWERVLDFETDIRSFITEHISELKVKEKNA